MRRQLRPFGRARRLGDLTSLAAQIQQYAANAGFSGQDLTTAVAIALAESGGNPAIVGDRTLAPTRGPSIGLWQINIGKNANPQFASWNLTDPQTNANAAFAIYTAIGGFGTTRGWTTYTSGAYAEFLPSVPPPTPAPLTIDASTGAPIDDSTPTPVLTPTQASIFSSPPSTDVIVGAIALGIGALILEDVLS